ncbi:hypothetical protein GOZ83_06150 [Agrobacterium vitis]|uniref:Lar family restriction alleviation protein n=1 Tax=Agrobacterium vitis TaxID=373 RepID=UPI0012E93742|nr:Lar family restriction alleviation protein [Agrobacterium vitis]MVA44663.1 hypothetical protein [Agrobacterium vitis]
MTETLLPCPFCGDKAQIEKWHGGQPDRHMVSCWNTDCDHDPRVIAETRAEAVQKWNRRAMMIVLECGGEAPLVYGLSPVQSLMKDVGGLDKAAQVTFDDIRAANDRIDAARRHLGDLVSRAFPPGKEIRWQYGNYVQRGVVTSLGMTGSINARNSKTGKAVSIYWSQILEVSHDPL